MLNNKYLLGLFVLMFATNVSAQSLPTQKDKYDFLGWYLKKYKLVGLSDTLQELERPNFKITQIESLSAPDRKFSKKDITYIKRQIQDKNKAFKLDSTLLPGAHWRPAGAKEYPFTYLSLPVFTRNKHMVLINRSNVCGPLCNEGNLEVYIRDKDGNWVW